MVFQINNISFLDNTDIPTFVHSELLGNVFFNATQYLMSRKGIYGTNAIRNMFLFHRNFGIYRHFPHDLDLEVKLEQEEEGEEDEGGGVEGEGEVEGEAKFAASALLLLSQPRNLINQQANQQVLPCGKVIGKLYSKYAVILPTS